MPSYELAEAKAFVAHQPGTRLEVVGDIALVSMGAPMSAEQLAYHASQMDAALSPVQNREAFAA